MLSPANEKFLKRVFVEPAGAWVGGRGRTLTAGGKKKQKKRLPCCRRPRPRPRRRCRRACRNRRLCLVLLLLVVLLLLQFVLVVVDARSAKDVVRVIRRREVYSGYHPRHSGQRSTMTIATCHRRCGTAIVDLRYQFR